MARVPMDDVLALWETGERSWEGLETVLAERKGKAEGIEDVLVDYMLSVSRERRSMGEPFPETAQELYDIMNEELEEEEAEEEEEV